MIALLPIAYSTGTSDINEWMNECVYLSLKQNFCNEIQLDVAQSCYNEQIELTAHTSCYWGLRLTLC